MTCFAVSSFRLASRDPSSSRVVSVECQLGSYFTDDDCVLCDFGTFQNESGQSFCYECPQGNTTRTVGARNESDCDGEISYHKLHLYVT